jgi:hypothetical protein
MRKLLFIAISCGAFYFFVLDKEKEDNWEKVTAAIEETSHELKEEGASYSKKAHNVANGLKKDYSDYTLKQLALSITKDITDPKEKVYALAHWTTYNIPYDYELLKVIKQYEAKEITATEYEDFDYDFREAFRLRKGVCHHITLVFNMLCHHAGIKAYYVSGSVTVQRTNGFGIGRHAWSLVEIEGEYCSLDVTWGKNPKRTFDKEYFLQQGNSHFTDNRIVENLKKYVPEKDEWLRIGRNEWNGEDYSDIGTADELQLFYTMQSQAVASSDDLKHTLDLLNGEIVTLEKEKEEVSEPVENRLCNHYKEKVEELNSQYTQATRKKERRKIKRKLRKIGKKFRKCGCD